VTLLALSLVPALALRLAPELELLLELDPDLELELVAVLVREIPAWAARGELLCRWCWRASPLLLVLFGFRPGLIMASLREGLC
jgi:hypothetical protein